MNKEIWEIWLEDEERREKDFHRYSKSKKVKREIEIQELVKGHIDKADHNLKFTNSILEAGKFNDWAVVSAYYSIYHVSLALCALKGYSTKDHLATLLILIREFYKKELNKEDIEVIGNATIKKKKFCTTLKQRQKGQ
ncbi:DNA-binding protein [Candidatus Pacearchaeota archaeon]|nr:DNA-binding protein [Candidatus Pacearchaeota archaeon]